MRANQGQKVITLKTAYHHVFMVESGFWKVHELGGIRRFSVGDNHLGNPAQLLFIHDANELNQAGTEHVGSLIFRENEQVFEQHTETLRDQLQGIKTGKINATLKSGHVPGINSHSVGKLFLRQSRLLTQLLNPPPDSLFGVHALAFRVDGAISHRDATANRGREMQKLHKTRRETFHLLKTADTIAGLQQVMPDKGAGNVANSPHSN